MVRTQIYLSEEQERVLAELASRRRTTKAQLVREAIDAAYLRGATRESLLQALAKSAGAWRRRENGALYVERLRSGRLSRMHAADRK